MIELKVEKNRQFKVGTRLEVAEIRRVSNDRTRVTVNVEEPAKARIIVTRAPRVIDWSRIADMIAEGYNQGVGRPAETIWGLFTE